MNRDEFMKYAMEETKSITDRQFNRIMNVIERAWAEGKKAAEIEGIGEIVKAQYAERKKRYDEYMVWKKAEAEGRLSVLPWATDITIERDGLLYKGDHWNLPTLTAFADDPTTRTGKRVCLFYPEEVKCAEAALRKEADDGT